VGKSKGEKEKEKEFFFNKTHLPGDGHVHFATIFVDEGVSKPPHAKKRPPVSVISFPLPRMK
jgi:hypothetical protein